MSSLEDIQAAVLAIPGVVGVEVADRGSALPAVRVWTDDSREPDDLRAEVSAVVARARAGAETAPVVVRPEPPAPGQVPKRSGLGRGLGSLISVAEDDPPPAHLIAIDLTTAPRLELVAIEESAAGVTVRAVDSAGSSAETKVRGGAAAVNPAIVAAVAELRGELAAPRLVAVELRDTEVASIMVVTLELLDGTVAAGAAVVSGGMPFSLGKAAWTALQSVNGR